MSTDTNQALKERLFAGVYPSGILYADRHRESAGDYKRLGFLDYATLTLKLEPDCPDSLAALIREDASQYQEKVGEEFQVSTTGQTVILGSALVAQEQEATP